jgi:hypothetical protein
LRRSAGECCVGQKPRQPGPLPLVGVTGHRARQRRRLAGFCRPLNLPTTSSQPCGPCPWLLLSITGASRPALDGRRRLPTAWLWSRKHRLLLSTNTPQPGRSCATMPPCQADRTAMRATCFARPHEAAPKAPAPTLCAFGAVRPPRSMLLDLDPAGRRRGRVVKQVVHDWSTFCHCHAWASPWQRHDQ